MLHVVLYYKFDAYSAWLNALLFNDLLLQCSACVPYSLSLNKTVFAWYSTTNTNTTANQPTHSPTDQFNKIAACFEHVCDSRRFMPSFIVFSNYQITLFMLYIICALGYHGLGGGGPRPRWWTTATTTPTTNAACGGGAGEGLRDARNACPDARRPTARSATPPPQTKCRRTAAVVVVAERRLMSGSWRGWRACSRTASSATSGSLPRSPHLFLSR